MGGISFLNCQDQSPVGELYSYPVPMQPHNLVTLARVGGGYSSQFVCVCVCVCYHKIGV